MTGRLIPKLLLYKELAAPTKRLHEAVIAIRHFLSQSESNTSANGAVIAPPASSSSRTVVTPPQAPVRPPQGPVAQAQLPATTTLTRQVLLKALFDSVAATFLPRDVRQGFVTKVANQTMLTFASVCECLRAALNEKMPPFSNYEDAVHMFEGQLQVRKQDFELCLKLVAMHEVVQTFVFSWATAVEAAWYVEALRTTPGAILTLMRDKLAMLEDYDHRQWNAIEGECRKRWTAIGLSASSSMTTSVGLAFSSPSSSSSSSSPSSSSSSSSSSSTSMPSMLSSALSSLSASDVPAAWQPAVVQREAPEFRLVDNRCEFCEGPTVYRGALEIANHLCLKCPKVEQAVLNDLFERPRVEQRLQRKFSGVRFPRLQPVRAYSIEQAIQVRKNGLWMKLGFPWDVVCEHRHA